MDVATIIAIVTATFAVAGAYYQLNSKIENLKKNNGFLVADDRKVYDIREKVEKLKRKIVELQKDYDYLAPKLDPLKSNSKYFDDIKDLLDIVTENPREIDFINKCKKLEQQVTEIKETQNSQGLIKIGRYDKINKNKFPELENGSGDRVGETYINFGYTFSVPPEVFVSLAEIDARISEGGKIVRLHVFVKPHSVTETGFTVVAKTWGTSKVYNVDLVWIAFGKPQQ